MENCNIIGSVNTLLQSDIKTSQLSKETGISKGYITNLRNGNRDIAKASYEVVAKLYHYFLKKKDYLEASKGIDEIVLKTKIPKDIQQFISSLKESIDSINNSSTNNTINSIVFKRIFNMNKSKQSSNFTKTYWQIDEAIPLEYKHDIYSYQLKILTPIQSKVSIDDEIENFEIIFNYNDLELMLKQLIHRGARVKLIKPNSEVAGIYIDNTEGEESFKYENSFIDIKVSFANKGGSM
ncbi:hypothetical protein [Staphylococcus hominis]|uniref:Uncharacterized protein n=1 Tax=Staphylococcus hominis TaxID=1290 RepID=A0A8X8KIG2_STAHO|nr:hypothetical protein [Staphylococcus hominis]MCM5672990.1 hypothetical protein [Staphylococcus hominis]